MLLLLALLADDWPQWRGPQRNGISAEKDWIETWPAEGPPVAWKAEVGTGFSSFAVAEGRAFTTGHADDTDTVFCFDAATGKTLWTHAYPSDLGDKFFEGGTTATPTVSDGKVYTIGRWGDAFCLEAATGRVVWKTQVQKETGVRIPSWGYSGSPVVHEDLLLLNVGEAGLALEKATGKIVWKSGDRDAGYATPLPVRRGDAWVVLLGSGNSYLALDPRTGKEAWRVRWVTSFGVNAADPVVDGDQVFVSSGYEKGSALLRMGEGAPATVWSGRSMRNMMNPCVLLAGHLYGVDGDYDKKPALKCVELATGAEKWSEPSVGCGSATAADGKLIVLSEKGELRVAPASPEAFRPSARAKVLGGKCWTVPVLANGRVYARNAGGDVVCLDLRRR